MLDYLWLHYLSQDNEVIAYDIDNIKIDLIIKEYLQ